MKHKITLMIETVDGKEETKHLFFGKADGDEKALIEAVFDVCYRVDEDFTRQAIERDEWEEEQELKAMQDE